MRRKKNKITCVIDPVFLVSWSKFRHGSKLVEVIERGYITDDFYDLFSGETTLSFLRSLLESKVLVIYDLFDESYNEILFTVRRTFIDDKRLCQLNSVLAKLLAIAIVENIPLFSDNYCVHKFARLYWDASMVWSSYRVLRYMVNLGLFDNLVETLRVFSEDTGTVFVRLRREDKQHIHS